METVIVTLLLATWIFNGLWIYFARVCSASYQHSPWSFRGLFWMLVAVVWPLSALILLAYLFFTRKRSTQATQAPTPA